MGFMAKNRNKGFSLIEVIIGVAVLTILLTPVVKQLAQTMKTNRLAKEQQYANENASSLMEYTQKSKLDELRTVGGSGDTYLTSSPVELKVNPDDEGITCELLVLDGGAIKPITQVTKNSENKTVVYTATKYEMNDVKLGSRKTEYSRTVILDDLSNKIGEVEFESNVMAGPSNVKKGLRIYYSKERSETLPSGYEYTSEGSIVKYSDINGVSCVTGIVCVLRNENEIVSDPNDSLLGSMHDLVRDQVALVNGDCSNFDKQATDDIYATFLTYLKVYDPDTYDKTINGTTGGFNKEDLTSKYKKQTTIKIDKVDVDSLEGYYLVKVDVKYEVNFRYKNGVPEFKYDSTYNVFAQKFTYNRTDGNGNAVNIPDAPAVYVEYQPFLVAEDGYAQNDYIFVENYVDNAKVYFLRPAKDYLYASHYDKITETGEGKNPINPTQENAVDDEIMISNDANRDLAASRVNIYLNAKTGTNSAGVITTKVRTNVYTNLKLEANETNVNLGQFVLGATGYDNFNVNPATYDEATATKPTLYLKDISEDYTQNERLYTATVIIAPTDDSVNTVKITGAKGGK